MHLIVFIRFLISCCNTCEDVRNAYRGRGWAFTDPMSIAQVQYNCFFVQYKCFFAQNSLLSNSLSKLLRIRPWEAREYCNLSDGGIIPFLPKKWYAIYKFTRFKNI